VSVSASLKEGDRNVLKLKFARPKREESAAAAAPTAVAATPPATEAWGEPGGEGRSRPRRQVRP
jgi:hypothetical protein